MPGGANLSSHYSVCNGLWIPHVPSATPTTPTIKLRAFTPFCAKPKKQWSGWSAAYTPDSLAGHSSGSIRILKICARSRNSSDSLPTSSTNTRWQRFRGYKRKGPVLHPGVVARGTVNRWDLASHRPNVSAQLTAVVDGIKKNVPEELAERSFSV